MSRGGKRNGAGRKPRGDAPAVRLVAYVAPETEQQLRAAAEAAGVPPGVILDGWAEVQRGPAREPTE